jgi:hypothetical protein
VVPQPATASVLLTHFLLFTLFFVDERQGGEGFEEMTFVVKLRLGETSAETWRLAKRGLREGK